MVEARSGSLLGSVALRVDWEDRVGEIGYWVAAHARRRGVGTRTVRLVARWAFGALALARVQILTDPANLASQRVAERAGFTREGLLRSYREHKGGRKDFVVYSLLRNDP